MKSKLEEKTENISQDNVFEMSFREFEKKHQIKLRHPPRQGIPGFPVSKVSTFRWIKKEEIEMVRKYSEGTRKKSKAINLNVVLYKIKKTLIT